MLISMEFNTLLEHFGRSGYNITNNINAFMNSKKQVVLRFRRIDEWWFDQTKYKFKTPSTIHDVSNILKVSKSIKKCYECNTIYSDIENIKCPECSMKYLLNLAHEALPDETDCSLCGTKCFNGMVGKCGKTKLTCGHQMCNDCYDSIKKNGDKFICTDNSMKVTITCPFCRAKENVVYN